MASNDRKESIGKRGHSIVESRLLDFSATGKPLFRLVAIGEKWPTTDLYVELLGAGKKVLPYFFIQVKATKEGFQKKNGNLKVKLKKVDIARLAAIPAPTYLVGVEVTNDRDAFILSVRTTKKKSLSSIPRAHDLSYANLKLLYNEVKDFWDTNKKKPNKSYFEV